MPDQVPKQYNAAAQRWLWIWVGVFTTFIVVLWGWATTVSLASFSWNKTPEKQLLDTSKTDWDTLFNNETTRLKNEQLKSQLKNLINQISTETNSTTASTTPTTNISSSTPATSTPTTIL